MDPSPPPTKRHNEYWWWFVGSITLLMPLDMLTTMAAVSKYGVQGEANPFMRELLQSEWYILLIVNLGLAFLTIGFFYGVIEMGEKTPEHLKRPYYLVCEIWMGSIISIGLAVFVNNLTAIVFGESLFSSVLLVF